MGSQGTGWEKRPEEKLKEKDAVKQSWYYYYYHYYLALQYQASCSVFPMCHLQCALYFKWDPHVIEEEQDKQSSQAACSKANSSQVAEIGFESRSDLNETQEPILQILDILLGEGEGARQVSGHEVKELNTPSMSCNRTGSIGG